MKQTPVWWLFWASFGLILYSYIGFPLLTILRGKLRPKPIAKKPYTPKVSIIIAAFNEAAVILDKIENTFKLDYPHEQMEIIVASDGSYDDTNRLVAENYSNFEVTLLPLPRQGKNLTLNEAVAIATGDILVFTDADAMLTPDALRHLTAPFSDPTVGGVGGDYRHATAGDNGEGERAYWNFDRKLKQLQSNAGSMTSATGALYAIRRDFFIPIPVGVTDDYYTSVQVLAAHRRLIFEPQAVATGPIATSSQAEFKRKVRIISAGLQGVWTMRRLFNPFEYGYMAVQVFSHKFLRRVMVIPLIILAVTAPALWNYGWFYKLATIGQFSLHGAALTGFLLQDKPIGQKKVLKLPFFFDMVYTAAAVAIVNNLKAQKSHDTW